jgi:hypothetical protein
MMYLEVQSSMLFCTETVHTLKFGAFTPSRDMFEELNVLISQQGDMIDNIERQGGILNTF